ncbi:MAG: urease accessory protein UreD [Candidatus Sedimenticola sp. 20ELBAFRAG]
MSAAEKITHGWHASLHLGFQKSPGKTLLAQRRREGPLAVQRAFYPEGDLCHVYLLHPPGGVAGGDQLDIRSDVAEGASALVTTPGATKFYRSLGPKACQRQQLTVTGGSLEWLPQENILFPGAEVELSTRVELRGDASFIGWEINCLGRPAIDERFDQGNAAFSFSLLKDGLPLLHERQVIDSGTALRAAAGLRNQPVFATLYATPAQSGLVESLRELIPQDSSHHLGITLVDGLLIARYLGDSAETARQLFIEIWKAFRPAVLNRLPSAPRIWNT